MGPREGGLLRLCHSSLVLASLTLGGIFMVSALLGSLVLLELSVAGYSLRPRNGVSYAFIFTVRGKDRQE